MISRRQILRTRLYCNQQTQKTIKKTAQITDMLAYALPVIEYVPTTYQEVRMSGEAKDWKGAMDEMDSLYKSYTWELVNHPKGKKVIRCK